MVSRVRISNAANEVMAGARMMKREYRFSSEIIG